MISVITSLDKINTDDAELIRDIDSFFILHVPIKGFTSLDREVIKRIDNADLLDGLKDGVKTPSGITSIYNLSTGCKTALVYLYFQRNRKRYGDIVIDVTGCGANALDVLFDCASRLVNNNIYFLLRHRNRLFKLSNRDFNVNGNDCKNLSDGVALYGWFVWFWKWCIESWL